MCNLCVFRKCDSCGKHNANFCCTPCDIHLSYFCNLELTIAGVKRVNQCPMCKCGIR